MWCWVAVTHAVARFLNPRYNRTLCETAQDILMSKSLTSMFSRCCSRMVGWVCNRPYPLQYALQFVKHFKDWKPGLVPASEIMDQIDSGKPLCCQIAWRTSGIPHFLLITGYYNGGQGVYMQDPASQSPTNVLVNYQDLVHGSTAFPGNVLYTFYV